MRIQAGSAGLFMMVTSAVWELSLSSGQIEAMSEKPIRMPIDVCPLRGGEIIRLPDFTLQSLEGTGTR